MVAPSPSPPDLILYTRDGCTLCDDAAEAINEVLDARGTGGLPVPVLRVVDISSDDGLEAAYRERIPVVSIGGDELDLVIRPRRLAALLERVLDGVTAA